MGDGREGRGIRAEGGGSDGSSLDRMMLTRRQAKEGEVHDAKEEDNDEGIVQLS